MKGEFRKTLIGSEPHILLHPQDKKPTDAKSAADVLAKVRQQPDVLAASSYIGSAMFAEHDGQQSGMDVLGLPEDGAKFYMAKVAKHRLEGSLELTPAVWSVPITWRAGSMRIPETSSACMPSSNVTSAVKRFRVASDEQDEAKRHAAYEEIKLNPGRSSCWAPPVWKPPEPTAMSRWKRRSRSSALGDQVSGVLIELKAAG